MGRDWPLMPTIRESRGGSNGNAECGHFYERRTLEMKPTSQSWQAAREEPQSRPLIRSWNENLDSTDKYNPTEICCGCKIPEFSRNLIFIIFIPKGIVVFTLTFNKGQCLFPSLIRDLTPRGSPYEIRKLEMDSAIAT
jgi:hypothetical protein